MDVLTNNEMVTGGGEIGDQPIRLAILQCVCTRYQVGLFRRLSEVPGSKARLFIGADIPGGKVKSAVDLSGMDVLRLPTRFIRLGRRVLLHHRGLLKELEKFQPDVILCEGESNFLSYLKALWYRRGYKQVGLVHWSLGGLPGVDHNPWRPRYRLKYFFRKVLIPL